MKSFACGDVVPGCTARWEEPTDEAVLSRVAEHAASVHGLVEVPAELVAAVRAAIRPVAAPAV